MECKKNLGRFTVGFWTDKRDRKIDFGRVLYQDATKWWAAIGPIHIHVLYELKP